jgi:PKD repeat protein
VKTDGTVWAWGSNTYGQLGDGTTTPRRTPVQVQGISNVVSVAGGRDHVLALKSDGTVWAWGWNAYGQLGDGTLTNRSLPVQITTGVSEVAAGAHHSYALKTDGSVIAWGRNYHAELGDGTLTNRTRPVSVTSAPGVPVTGAVSIGSGRDNGTAVMADGRVMAWGENLDGQLADGTFTNKTRAFFMPGVSGATEANGGSGHTVILVNTGPPPPNQPPVAAFTSTCTGLTCTFDGTTSHDPDGMVKSYAWDFGDTQTDSGSVVSHTFASADTYAVQLTVTDDDNEPGSISHDVAVTDPPPTQVAFRGATATNTNVAKPSVRVPASVVADDVLVLVMTTNRNATTTTPSGWTLRQTILDGTDLRSWVFTRTATAGLANTPVTVTLDAVSKTSMTISAYSGATAVTAVAGATEPGTSANHTSPPVSVTGADGWVVSYWADKTSGHTPWVLPSNVNRRLDSAGTSSGQIVAVLGDTGSVSGTWPGATATSGVSSGKAVAWSIVVE